MLRDSIQGIVLLTLAASVAAQSNTVVGLDGRLTQVDNLTYYGRRGAAYPNGEIGMAMLNEMCNPGSVTIPWYAAMQSNHPKFGFLLVRLSNDRLEQISDWSFCKHAFTSTNYTGPCGPCQNPSTGTVMGINCADTYGAGNNADRTWLGPPSEIDPWLGTWNPVGSYFDVGDPQTGLGPADGVRSLNTSGFDNVKNRVTVQEVDLTTPGASYFYGIHLIHQGEALANRGDNLASRGTNPTWSGSTWSFPNNAVGQTYGSILHQWPGATIDSGHNGNDDGRFFVAVKVSPLGGGQYHYEYAVHNVDNNRGGASLRIPVDPAAVVVNYSFGDIDSDPLNDWTGAKVGSEVVFTATANNPQNWNTIYNFGFDCDIAPSFGVVTIDQARIGPGALSVSVNAQVPSGIPSAQVAVLGTSVGCGSCQSAFYEMLTGPSFDLANSAMALTYANGQYTAGSSTATYVTPTGTNLNLTDDSQTTIQLPFSLPFPGGSTSQLNVCSNGFISVGSNGTPYIPDANSHLSGAPRWAASWRDLNPALGGQVLVDSTPTEVRVTWSAVRTYGSTQTNTFQYQFRPNGDVQIVWQTMDSQNGDVLVGWSPGGVTVDPGPSDISASLPGGINMCAQPFNGLQFASATRPILGTSVSLTTSNIPAGTPFGAVLLSLQQAVPPLDLTGSGMPGCYGHVVGGVTHLFVAPGSTHNQSLAVPVDPAFTGLEVAGQSFTYSPGLTPAGVVASNGLLLIIGPQ
ncbi:MAG: hypothetical protein H6838_17500 [Planctomycetes bacterium]|nr:hypothetical protein [Planctomycetota bacterium]MCB9887289.1 hypothetical protein [Planctomycetota bacterium]